MTHPASRETTGTVSGTTFSLALIGMAVRAASTLARVLKNRQQITQLHQLDDRALKDIGLMRTDVNAALSQPFYHDPSQHLMAIAGHKRSGSKPEGGFKTPGINRLRHANAIVATKLPDGCIRA